ncbi:MAG: cobaltochelatase subunit CobN, partial [Bacillota bacterium]
MTHPLRLVAIGFEPAQAGPLRQAAAALGPDQIAWRPLPVAALQEPAALAAALDQADGLLCTTVLDPADARALSALLAERSRLAFIPVAPNAPDLLSRARLGSFDASAAATPWLHPAARAAAAEGLKLPPVAAPLIQSLAQFAHRLPPEAGDLALLGRVLQAVQNPSPANAHLALQTLRWALRPGSVAEPPWPQRYPRTGFYHPDRGLFPDWSAFEKALTPAKHEGRVMLVCFRPQVIAGDDAHLRALICALEAQSLQVIPWFGALDAAPEPPDLPDDLDLWINASGFTLMGSHARPDVAGGAALLRRLDTPCLAPVPLFGQSLQQWEANRLGIAPMQVAMQVAIPELEGGIAPILLAGRDESTGAMAALPEQAERLARLARRYVDLRRLPNRQKRVAITLFSFPPDQGAVGTAAYLDLFASLHHLLRRMRAEGYTVELPDSPEALQRMLTEGPPVAARYPAARYVAAFPEVERISRCWGRPPGEVLTDGTHFEIQGCRLGNIFIGIQPPFGYEGDPMALLFHPEASPSHAFAAYYTWLAHEYQPHALLHFGTHGALEFMPGKQVGLAPRDYPDRLVGDLPHLYFYCINNPAEGAIARRRSHAALVSYLSPPLAEAGLYGALAQIREEVHRCRTAPQPPNLDTLTALATAAGLDADADPALAQTDPDR